jgi:hypothetical protein
MAAKLVFEVPTVQQVIAYLTEKRKDWPEKFIEYYGNRFWNHYQSNGWLVSGKSKMKDWKAAVNGQWSILKFREDIEMLQKFTAQKKTAYQNLTVGEVAVGPPENTVSYMDEVLETYIKHPTSIPKERLASCYDWLKEKKLIRITKEQKDIAVQAGDINKGKALVVQFVFDMMAAKLVTFNQLVYAR